MSAKKDDSSSSHDEKQDPEAGAIDVPVLVAGDAKGSALDIALTLPGMTGVHKDDELDPAESRRVKRKLDMRIVPLLCAYVPSYSSSNFLLIFFIVFTLVSTIYQI